MKKILIANRGEIAVRIIRTCREMGIATAAVYSVSDRTALHVRMADEAVAVGPDAASESYLRVDKLVGAARRVGADGVHPGYGFLAENADFAGACAAAGLTFIGPSPEAMRLMGSKTSARRVAAGAGVPIVPGSDEPLTSEAGVHEAATVLGYPLLVKAVGGGGGKGMRVVRSAEQLAEAVRLARSEAQSAFGDDRIYIERLLDSPRHIEVQLLGDGRGAVVPFVERECSIQRRHQKLIEETPSPAITSELRAELTAAAAAIGRAAGYTSAGTVEFLVDRAGGFYFLEMNTRLQVEHPITEAVAGLDIVRAQIQIARGEPLEDVLPARQGLPSFVAATGHAIEVRVYAEDPDAGFLPSPGVITHLRAPSGPGVRDDSGAYGGWTVPTAYDPLISKVIVWAPDRQRAIARMVRALTEYDIRGIRTTIGFCRELIESQEFAAGEFDTTSVDRVVERRGRSATAREEMAEEIAAISTAIFESTRDEGETKRPERPVIRAESLWAQRARLEGLR